MTKQLTSLAFALAALCWWLPAAALQEDQVQGEIVEVMPDTNRLSVRVLDSGDQRPERTGTVETYELEDDTIIRRGNTGSSVLGTASVTLSDLVPGDEVVLNFEELEGRRVARNVEISDREQAAAARQDEQPADDEADIAQFETQGTVDRQTGTQAGTRDRLPATASLLPLLAFGGLGVAGAALLVRRRR
jgi:hypothetical protein